ncbi:MAG: hypothetical protein U0354_01005 [Candidatus Sericytochromatia bacterium]
MGFLFTSTHLQSPWTNENYIYDPETNSSKIFLIIFGAYIAGEQTLNFYDKVSKEAYFWSSNANNLSDWLTAAPIRTILNWFLSVICHLIHGAGMDTVNSVYLVQKLESGKSTTALSCIFRGNGLFYLIDYVR